MRSRTGLILDPYFSASKLRWLFEDAGVSTGPEVAFGTVDTWLLWRLTAGAVHATDPTNASRTLLYDIEHLRWDAELGELFGVPPSVLPEVCPSSGRLATTAAGAVPGLPGGVPISGMAGDQQAALFGQACFRPGMTKNTYGTGSFVLMNVGPDCPAPADGLLTTVAWDLGRARLPTPSKVPSSSPAPPSSGCATSSTWSRTRPRSVPWPPLSPTRAAPTWSRPSPVSAARGGTLTPGARWSV